VTEVDTFLAGNSKASLRFYAFARFLVVGFARLLTRVRIDGIEHVPTSGAYILAPTHRSNIDTPLAAAITGRRIRFMGKDTLWTNPRFGWLLSALGAFPVTRGTADREALARCEQVLRAGEPLVVFPEGERKRGPIVQPLHDGATYLAVRTGVPIVPVGIGGSERVMPKGSKLLRPSHCEVVVGPPIFPPALEGNRVPRAKVRELSAALHDELQRLFDTAQARVG
jgi:1-acyl-sn-glycerol-3-phosphate acyltransferase